MKVYKLTDENGRTYNGTQWGVGITHKTDGRGDLCGSGWLHASEDPLLAVFLNPIQARFTAPRMWEARATGKIKRDGQLKLGCTLLTTVREIPLPEITTEQRVRFAVLCAMKVYTDKVFLSWAQGWLDDKDRSEAAAWAAAWAAWAAAGAAWAAEAAAWAAAGAAAWAAAGAAEAAAEAAEAAAEAAEAAADKLLDLVALAREAMQPTRTELAK